MKKLEKADLYKSWNNYESFEDLSKLNWLIRNLKIIIFNINQDLRDWQFNKKDKVSLFFLFLTTETPINPISCPFRVLSFIKSFSDFFCIFNFAVFFPIFFMITKHLLKNFLLLFLTITMFGCLLYNFKNIHYCWI